MAGHAHTLVSTVSGNVWVFGCGLFGQLGNGSNKKSTVPLKVDFSKAIDGRGVGDVIDLVACGYFHNYALSAGIHLFQLLNMFFGSSVKSFGRPHFTQYDLPEVQICPKKSCKTTY